ncbi:MAG: DNA mismatch repair endonuclease MutL [Oscillospiraceae bacterium]|jgi:DNA mismatch repair protein MutL|nr:DNA mismatch repair endonuclease MutL [Oscillospiraceae bacterium]
MPTIQVLPKRVAELIAAGEVIDRPASAVKELCENALDAGATAVTVEIRSGGIKYIRVQDNGCGIPAAELPTAFLPHATSKIYTAEDIDCIRTLGFRGEALPSIAAVARVEVLTRTADAEIGVRYCIASGEAEAPEQAGCALGTAITVRDLFYQTPARMKFLKKDVAEGNAVGAVLERLALSRPDAAFTFLREGKEVFRSPGGGSPGGAVRAVLGKAFFEHMLGTTGAYEACTVSGFVSEPAAARPNRNQQYFFLNGRSIRCPAASAALGEAYKRSIPAGKFPACVLYITIPPGFTDINVHPAKMEVRFADERPVFLAVRGAAMAVLNGGQVMEEPRRAVEPARREAPVLPETPARTFAPPPVQPVFSSPPFVVTSPPPADDQVLRDSTGWAENPFAPARETPPLLQTQPERATENRPAEQTTFLPPEERSPVRVLGEAFRTYFLAERGDELLLIDKHAAHERMLYERLRAEYAAEGARRQLLLEPLPLHLSREESAALLENRALLEEAGYLLEEFGSGTLLLRECPLPMVGSDLAAELSEIAGYLLEKHGEIDTQALDWIFHSAACRAAVKAGDPTTPTERERFVETLLALPGITHCPHGRPVTVTMQRKELEKRFGR